MSEKISAIGSKAMVFHGTAKHTSGGLFKDDLMRNKRGKIVSKRQSAAGKKAFAKNKLKPLSKSELASIRPK